MHFGVILVKHHDYVFVNVAHNYSGGKKNPDLLLIYQKRTNESQTVKQIVKNSYIVVPEILGIVVFER